MHWEILLVKLIVKKATDSINRQSKEEKGMSNI